MGGRSSQSEPFPLVGTVGQGLESGSTVSSSYREVRTHDDTAFQQQPSHHKAQMGLESSRKAAPS